jgi:hypothetical protein
MKRLNEIFSRIKSYFYKSELELRMPISKSVYSNNYFQSLTGFKRNYSDPNVQVKFTLPLTFRAAVAPQSLT